MRIKNRIKSVDALLATASKGAQITPAITQFAGHEKKLHDMGFSWPLVVGESVLPPGHCGIACSQNANGWEEKHKNRALEIFHYWQLWKWKMTRKHYFDRDERFVLREKKRYPRTLHPPCSMEIQVLKRDDGAVVLALPSIALVNANKAHLIIAINVLVEIFGSCFLLNEILQPVTPIRHSHWKLLSLKGMSWASVEPLIQEILNSVSGQSLQLARYRFETIRSMRPSLCAIGQQGFLGHIFFGFPERQLHLLDSICGRGETCAFTENWENLSRLTISSLLDDRSHLFRISHFPKWREELVSKLQDS